MTPDLAALAKAMLAEADKVVSAGPGAAAIARGHLERMIQAARSAGLGGDLSAFDLAALRRKLQKIASDCAWDLGGVGNRESWAFGRVVEAVRAAGRVTSPLLEAAGAAAVSPTRARSPGPSTGWIGPSRARPPTWPGPSSANWSTP